MPSRDDVCALPAFAAETSDPSSFILELAVESGGRRLSASWPFTASFSTYEELQPFGLLTASRFCQIVSIST